MLKKNIAYILGGGITSAAIADLLKNKFQVIVIEKDSELGGMVRTRKTYGINHEFGPHVLYGKNDFHKAWWGRFVENNLQDYYVRLSIDGSLKQGSLFDFPISEENIRRITGQQDILSGTAPEGTADLNFEDFMIAQLGKPAYEAFIKGYNLKQWGIEPSKMSSEWASFRPLTLKKDSPTKMFGDAWAGHPGDYTPVFDECFKDTVAYRNEEVIGIGYDKATAPDSPTELGATKIFVRYHSPDLGEGTIKSYDVRKGDIVINTIPIDAVFPENPLTWRGIIKFFAHYKKPNLMPAYSVTFPNNYNWTRILEYPKHSGVDSENETLLSFAVPFDPLNPEEFEEKRKETIKNIESFSMENFGILPESHYYEVHDKVYPVSLNTNLENLNKSFHKLSKFGNLWSIGRLGIYAYISMSRAIDMAQELYTYLESHDFKNENSDETFLLYKKLRSDLW